MSLNLPRLLIAGTASGVGKTLISYLLIAELRARGWRVQPFKVGPDYLDASHLAQAAGRPCYNLDTWLMPSARLETIVASACRDADLAIIEGMMGLYDGREAHSDAGSAAEIARLLQTPVILVLDAWAQARSAAAVVLGFQQFAPQLALVGVIANRVAGPGHARLLREALASSSGMPLLAAFPALSEAPWPERHLGLLPASEQALGGERLNTLLTLFRQSCDLEQLLTLARQAPPLATGEAQAEAPLTAPGEERVRLALAYDEAFSFYYPDTLDLLRQAGAELVPFSPLRDHQLPAGCSGLYLGGGFPEEYAALLAANERLRRQLAELLAAGLPCYAECGGLMYLCHHIRTASGESYPMLGVIERESILAGNSTDLRIGYRLARAQRESLLLPRGVQVRGHEFHYSHLDADPTPEEAAYMLSSPDGQHQQLEGFARDNLLASYLHLSFSGFPEAAQRFVAAARRWRQVA
ncbi:cobyrinic acid a,c-diamide synthase [Thermogemmatispora aurantia]|uniref:Cobyrinate a,c-diamide synthase n=1 Tax=Thermogemmatispora aurantia TaxID=2045279 RepID=A0A5J4KAT6_9CHLR|nr:cobyrinate a,c-diamide synthase [Thermogemmatispora aurantia]GER83266.1 cobyrinic acid a,c-diamide synthase [Thermogemmatispora aurantia]